MLKMDDSVNNEVGKFKVKFSTREWGKQCVTISISRSSKTCTLTFLTAST